MPLNHRVTLLSNHFFARRDRAAALAPWGKPCPVDVQNSFEDSLRVHVEGVSVPAVTLRRMDDPHANPITGRFRLGSYVPDENGKTPWLCIDIDGPGHAKAILDPVEATLRIRQAFDDVGVPVYLEKSGSGKGWHIWVFFDPIIPAAKARRLALALISRDIPASGGGHANPERNLGIEVFPKRSTIAENGFGNMVWLPWWFGAKGDANQFHVLNGDGSLHPSTPDGFTTISESKLDQVLADLAPPRPTSGIAKANTINHKVGDRGTAADDTWHSWRAEALAKLDLNAVYGEWLTGKSPKGGWLECRVPWSPSGDRNPSGGIADGTGDAERGAFHDFTSGETFSVFDFLVKQGRAIDFKAARETIANITGIPVPQLGRLEGCEDPTSDASQPVHLTELGNAYRLIRQHGQDLRFVCPSRKWYFWDGRRWVPDETGESHRRMKATVRGIYAEAAQCKVPDRRDKLAKWAIRSESERVIRAGLTLAQSDVSLAVHPSVFDTDPWSLTCASGTIDLRTGTLRDHRREDLITRLAPVEYDPQARCPTWERFLAHVTGRDKALQGFLKRAVGYSLTGDTSAQVLFMLHGTGENGKSTFLDVLKALFGDYALHTPTETLMVKRQAGIPNDQARLAGARLITAIEVEDGHRMSESLVKQWTGGDTVTARFLNREFFQFKPCGKIWIAVNHKPQIRGTDHAIWRRIRLIPFSVRITKKERDDHLIDKLRLELPGVLNWAVEGCMEWREQGLDEPPGVLTATDDYRAEMDVLGNFLEEHCLLGSGRTVQSSQLYGAYTKWCEQSHETALTMTKFAERLKERGFEKRKSDGVMNWQGLGLLTVFREGCP